MTTRATDPVELAIFQNAVHSVAERDGSKPCDGRHALARTSKSAATTRAPSSIITAGVIAMGDHMPRASWLHAHVRAGSDCRHQFGLGDIAILNDPYAGGTHLPDITMVLPVFLPGAERPSFYVSNRAHHADVGGRFAGSMGPAEEIFQEGIRIPPVRIVRRGQLDREMLDLILMNVRTPKEREGDLESQIGACRVGERRILELAEKFGEDRLRVLTEELLDYSERLVRAVLRCSIPAGEFNAEDWLDDDGVTDVPRKIAVRLDLDRSEGKHSRLDALPAHRRRLCGQRECGARHYAVCVLLCLALPASPKDAPATEREYCGRSVSIHPPEAS